MTAYRTIPVRVDAIQWRGSDESTAAVEKWGEGRVWPVVDSKGPYLVIQCEPRYVVPGDWLVRDQQGHIVPVAGDVFDTLYEPVNVFTQDA